MRDNKAFLSMAINDNSNSMISTYPEKIGGYGHQANECGRHESREELIEQPSAQNNLHLDAEFGVTCPKSVNDGGILHVVLWEPVGGRSLPSISGHH